MRDPEETITDGIENLLNQVRDGKRRASMLRLFAAVERSGQHRAAGASFRQSPDLAFRPRSAHRGVRNLADWALFTECKIVGLSKQHTPSIYCTKGVARFASGDYAPRMNIGLLVAYVRDGATPHASLKALFASAFGTMTMRGNGDILHSTHDRSSLPTPCAEIELAHLWLDARLR